MCGALLLGKRKSAKFCSPRCKYEAGRSAMLEKSKSSVATLDEKYVRYRIARETGCGSRTIPKELVEAQRANLLIKRHLKERK